MNTTTGQFGLSSGAAHGQPEAAGGADLAGNDDASLGGPGPLDGLTLYQLREKMPVNCSGADVALQGTLLEDGLPLHVLVGDLPEPEPVGVGLSSSHSCPQLPREPVPAFVVADGGNVVEVHARQTGVNKRVGGGARGKIRDFSRGSRRRMLRLLNSLDRSKVPDLPIFLTLTYPGKPSEAWPNIWPDDPAVWKEHLVSFCKRIERRYPEASIIWRLELQKRGAPHFHLLVFGVPVMPWKLVRDGWFEVVGSQDEAHRAAGTKIERVRSWNGVNSYAAKYMGKPSEGMMGQQWMGRHWGVRRREKLPVKWDTSRMTWTAFYRMRRVLRKYLHRKGMRSHAPKPWAGMSVFMACDLGIRLFMWAMGGS